MNMILNKYNQISFWNYKCISLILFFLLDDKQILPQKDSAGEVKKHVESMKYLYIKTQY